MRLFLYLLFALALVGCAAREVGTARPALGIVTDEPAASTSKPCASKLVWVTIDGTSNTPVSRTAAVRLHELVEAHSYDMPGHPLAIWYAEGVGSGDLDIVGKTVGVGVNEDIKNAYAFLTQIWQPCDRLFLNGFSRGAYTVRALGGLLYMAGIPDLRTTPAAERKKIVNELFDAYKTRTAYPERDGLNLRRAERIAAVYARHGLAPRAAREGGFANPRTKVVIEAITLWDTVQAMGLPDGSEDPAEGLAHFLITACNARAIFQALSLDDNRAYSFTPLLAGGEQATAACPADSGRQNVNATIEEAWFSGAHADVGGTYSSGSMLDGELASISLNWMLSRLKGPECPECSSTLSLPADLQVPENRLTAVHDGKRTSIAYRKLFRQTRKPSVYWARVYGSGKLLPVHASVFDRLERLFALDASTPGCNNGVAAPNPVICAREIASYGLVPELLKGGCLEPTDWGYRLKQGQQCVVTVGERSKKGRQPPNCDDRGKRWIRGWVYAGPRPEAAAKLAERKFVDVEPYPVPVPRCASGREAS
jgi:uncharacterized protein (DUF2235 family)